jgi:hypothetical protein
MSVLSCGAKGLVIAALGAALAIGLAPGAGWAASCLWLDMRKMDPPNPSRDGLIVAANLCPRDMRLAFGEWNPKTGKINTWSEKLPPDGESGDYVFLSIKPDYYMAATPCLTDCKAEQADFKARRTFSPAPQAVIWVPPSLAPAGW